MVDQKDETGKIAVTRRSRASRDGAGRVQSAAFRLDRQGRTPARGGPREHRVQVFDQNDKPLIIWPAKLIGRAVIYVDADDIVYTVEHNAAIVSVLTLGGERLAQ